MNKHNTLTDEEVYEIQEAFNLFDTEGNGTVDPKEIKCAMQSLGIDKKNPLVYQIITDMEKLGTSSVNFNDFLDSITIKIVRCSTEKSKGSSEAEVFCPLFRNLSIFLSAPRDNKGMLVYRNGSGDAISAEEISFGTCLHGNRDTKEGVRRIFNLFDEDNSGTITFRNLKKVATELGENLTDDELRDMINRADSNGDGQLSFDDFYNIMIKKNHQ